MKREETDKIMESLFGPYSLPDYADYDKVDWDKVPLLGYLNPIVSAARLANELEKAFPWWKSLFTE